MVSAVSQSTGHSLCTADNKLKYNRNLTRAIAQFCDSCLKKKDEDSALVHHQVCKCYWCLQC